MESHRIPCRLVRAARRTLSNRCCSAVLVGILMAIAAADIDNAFAQEPTIEVVPSTGHLEKIKSLAFSVDGRSVVSGSDDESVKLWDAESGRLLRTFVGHGEPVNAVACSPDKHIVASVSDHALKLWDALRGNELHSVNLGYPSRSVAFSPDGDILANSQVDAITLRDAKSGVELRTIALGNEAASYVVFSPDSKIIAAARGPSLTLWAVGDGRELRTLTGHVGNIRTIAFSPDGQAIASAGYDRNIKRWEVGSGRELRPLLGHRRAVSLIWFAPDGATISSIGTDGAFKLWDVQSGSELQSKEVQGQLGVAVSASAIGKMIVSGAGIKNNQLTRWDATTGRDLGRIKENDHVYAAAFSRDGRTLATGSSSSGEPKNDDTTLKLWDPTRAKLSRALTSRSSDYGDLVRTVAFSPDGRKVVTGGSDYRPRLWEAESGRELLQKMKGHEGTISALAFSPDGRTIVSASWDKTLKQWNATTGTEVRTFKGHIGEVNAVAFSPNGQLIASGSSDETIRLWDVKNSREALTLEAGRAVYALAFSWDGRLVSGGLGSTLKLWDPVKSRLLRTFDDKDVLAVAFSPDGRTIVSGGYDYALRLWDVETGTKLKVIQGHRGYVTSVAYSPDGRTIVSTSLDGTVRRWSSSGEPLALSISVGGEWLTVTPEGFFDASDGGTELLSVVRGLEAFSIDQFYQSLYRPDVVRQKLSMDENVNYRAAEATRALNLQVVLDSGAPPRIALSLPKAAKDNPVEKTRVEATLVDQGGGIGRLEWRVNGVTRGIQSFQDEAKINETHVTREFALGGGTNIIELVAYNRKNLAASMPISIAVDTPRAVSQGAPRLHVLAVGVNNYISEKLKLKFAVADAKAIASAFRLGSVGAGLYEGIEVHPVLLDEQVTAKSLQREFDRLGKLVRPQDVFVLYLAGHGVTENGHYYFVPHDADGKDYDSIIRTSISQDIIQQWLAEIPAFRSVIIYDTCESGSATQEPAAFRGTRQLSGVEKLSRSIGRSIVAATSDVANALEGYRNHGIFTYVVLEALSLADRNNDGKIDTNELSGYLRERLPALSGKTASGRQEPQAKLSGSSFVLVNRASAADINRIYH